MSETIRDYADNTLDGFDPSDLHGMTVTINVGSPEEGTTPATVEVTEYLEWHQRNHDETMDALTDQDGWLTPEATAAAVGIIREALPAWDVEDSDNGGDDPHLGLSVALPTPQGFDTPVEDVLDSAWAVVAEMANRTDPGTFGVRYLFPEVAQRLGAVTR